LHGQSVEGVWITTYGQYLTQGAKLNTSWKKPEMERMVANGAGNH
jgi:hypothetical protein